MITVVGTGPGKTEYIPPVALKAIEEADVLIGGNRVLDLFSNLNKKTINLTAQTQKVIAYLNQNGKKEKIVVLVTGDPGLFSFLSVIKRELPSLNLKIIPGISSIQLLFSKISESWEDVKFLSLHGRSNENFLEALKQNKKICFFTDAQTSFSELSRILRQYGWDGEIIIGENLSHENEQIIRTNLDDLEKIKPSSLSIVYLTSFKQKDEPTPGVTAGKLFGVGIGPGDSDLLTLKAIKILSNADVVFLPYAESQEKSLAFSIVKPFLKKARIEFLSFPMTRNQSTLKTHWSEAAEKVAKELSDGLSVAFTTLGDPSLYSTFGYLLRELTIRMPELSVEMIPGISSPSACAAAACTSLVLGKEKLAIMPGEKADKDTLSSTLEEFDTVMIMKIGKQLKTILSLIDELGLKDKATLVTHASRDKQEKIIRNLSNFKKLEENLGYLSSIIIKKK
ncbi:MAG: precorrin-2 C(20)-methyltransferase [Actinobacteria bacterium]|nr:precorrin-2 C(20)-methyltransferase [Actinomycetota bacterium]